MSCLLLCRYIGIYMSYQDKNAETIDRWVAEGWEWGIPVSHEEYLSVKAGKWQVLLTPTKPVPHEWFGDIKGKKLLGLASGGGQQIPIFSALGAKCTVLDYSKAQIDSEIAVAKREGYTAEFVRADMTKPLPFDDGQFDIIFHPVSNCYIEEVEPVFRECYRVLKKGGMFLAGLDNGFNYVFDDGDESTVKNSLPFNPLKDPDLMRRLVEWDDGVQFSHTIEEQIGGQLKAGFVLTDIYEDYNAEGLLSEKHIPTFIATRAIKK